MNKSPTSKKIGEKLEFRDEFCKRVHGGHATALFNCLPDVYFVVKDCDGRVVMANDVAVRLAGFKDETEMIGKRDHDIFDQERADLYVADDRHVFETGETVVDHVELAPDPDNAINWYVTTKMPVYDNGGTVIGLACVARGINAAYGKLIPYMEMNEVLEYVRQHYTEPVKVEDLARICNLSSAAFERKFLKVFSISPIRHIMNIRIRAACKLLTTTNDTITSIAIDSGFYDQSHFSRYFRKIKGMSPGEFRRCGGKIDL